MNLVLRRRRILIQQEEIVNRLLIDEEPFLHLALKSIIEALRMNPDKDKIIYDNKYESDGYAANSSSNTIVPISSSRSTYFTSTKPHQNYYYNKYHEGILELAKGFLKLLLNQLVDKTMVTAVKADVK